MPNGYKRERHNKKSQAKSFLANLLKKLNLSKFERKKLRLLIAQKAKELGRAMAQQIETLYNNVLQRGLDKKDVLINQQGFGGAA